MTNYSALRSPRAKVRPELVRQKPRILAGVARGLSVHLGGSVHWWRLGFIALTPVLGLGFLLYAALAFSMPSLSLTDAENAPLAPSLSEREDTVRQMRALSEPSMKRRQLLMVAGILGLTVLAFIIIENGVMGAAGTWLVPLLVVLGGAAIAWSHSITDDGVAPVGITAIGAIVAAFGAIALVRALLGWGSTVNGLVVGLAVIAALALVLVPVLVQNQARLREEQVARIREGERASIAAHLHDSVLQTLALIRARANEPEEVASLARAQERDLRRYLYAERSADGVSVAEQLRACAAEIEERFRSEIDVVITGDTVPGDETAALVGATREALTNACKHGGGTRVSLYAELGQKTSEVFVRDRGSGFDPSEVSVGAGIRDSIRARLDGVGGRVDIRSPLPTGGTEVRLSVEVQR